MKGMIIVLFLSFSLSSSTYASEPYDLKTLPPSVITHTDRFNDREIKREIREFNRFQKLVDRYLRQSERGSRVAARQTLRRLHIMMRSEQDQSRIKYRIHLRPDNRNRGLRRSRLYRRPQSPNSKRSPQYRRDRGEIRLSDLYRYMMLEQDRLSDEVGSGLRSRRIYSPAINEVLFAFERTLRNEIEWMTGDPRRVEQELLRARPVIRGRR